MIRKATDGKYKKVVLLDKKLPRKDDGSVDEEALEKVIDEA